MRYEIADCLADYGFSFLEKIHEPIFLVRKSGLPVRVNEAGRKFLKVVRVGPKDLEKFLKVTVFDFFENLGTSYRRISLGSRRHLIARRFPGSELVMIEIK